MISPTSRKKREKWGTPAMRRKLYARAKRTLPSASVRPFVSSRPG